MRTVRCIDRLGGVSTQGGVCLVGVSAWGDVCLEGVCLEGVCVGDVSAQGMYTTLTLWTEFLTHACENITFP